MSQISNASSTLTAFFDDRHDAEDAVRRLIEAGISQSSVRLVPGYESDQPVTDQRNVHKGFFESLADFFMPDEDRYSYAEGLTRGGYVVTVTDLSSSQYDIALDILDDEGAINLDEREENWRSEGWSGYNAGAYGSSTSGTTSTSDRRSGAAYDTSSTVGGDASLGSTSTGTGYASGTSSNTATGAYGNEEVIPVVEEQLHVGKRDVNLGRVRVRSYVREVPVSEQVALRDERVTLERRPVDRPLSGEENAFRERTIEAEEHAEEAVVAKEARVVEEIGLRKETEEHAETVSDTVRQTEVEVEDERGLTDRDTINRR